jgi:hypothetical protein
MGLFADASGKTRIRRLDIRTGRISDFSAMRDPVIDFAVNRSASVLAVMRPRPPKPAIVPDNGAGRVITQETPYELISGLPELPDRDGYGGSNIVAVQSAGHESIVSLPADEWPLANEGLSVSPSGRFVIIPVGMTRSQVPQGWLRGSVPASWVFLYGLRLYDRATNTLRWLVDAPTMWDIATPPTWSANEQTVFISSGLAFDSKGAPRNVGAIVAVQTGRVLAAQDGRLEAVSGAGDLAALRLMVSDQPAIQFRVLPVGDSWKFEMAAPSGVRIRLRQDMNRPPELVSHEFGHGEERQLLALNPGISGADVEVRQFDFTSKDGEKVSAGLYLPAHRLSGERLPLVVQTHGWDPTQFWYDGPSTAGFAARSLAQSGIIVAQIGGLPHVVAPSDEASAGREVIDSLIDALDRAGFVDTNRLGITAWSATGLAVRSALAFSRHHFDAAVLVDSRDDGYLSYLLSEPSSQREIEAEMGGLPYGRSLQAWAANSPMFNMDKVSTPVRLVELGPYILSQWEQWAAMKRLGKPIDFIWLPLANHWPIRPSERLSVQQGTVDWYRFWLQGRAEETPEKASEYARWETMRRASPNIAAPGATVFRAP